MEGVHLVNVKIHVAFERGPLTLWQVAAPNLEVDPGTKALHDRVDSIWFAWRRLEHAMDWIQRESEYVTIVLRGLTHPPYSENG
jgi:hypothetical protein